MEIVGVVLVWVAIIAAIVVVGNHYDKKRRAYLLAKYRNQVIVDKIMRRMVWQGMSQEQLLDSWGEPKDKDQKVYKNKVMKTFKYGKYGKNRFHRRVRLDNGIVVGWEQK
jgi:hypothetical protein